MRVRSRFPRVVRVLSMRCSWQRSMGVRVGDWQRRLALIWWQISDAAAEQADEAVDRPRFGPTGHGGGALRVPALRRAPGARSLSAVFDRPYGDCAASLTSSRYRARRFCFYFQKLERRPMFLMHRAAWEEMKVFGRQPVAIDLRETP